MRYVVEYRSGGQRVVEGDDVQGWEHDYAIIDTRRPEADGQRVVATFPRDLVESIVECLDPSQPVGYSPERPWRGLIGGVPVESPLDLASQPLAGLLRSLQEGRGDREKLLLERWAQILEVDGGSPDLTVVLVPSPIPDDVLDRVGEELRLAGFTLGEVLPRTRTLGVIRLVLDAIIARDRASVDFVSKV